MKMRWFEALLGMFLALVVVAVLLLLAAPALAGSKAATGSTSAGVLFGPDRHAGHSLEFLAASSDKAGSQVTIWQRGPAGKRAVNAAPTNEQVAIQVNNADSAFEAGDTVLYVHSSGRLDLRSLSGATATALTLDAGVSQAGTTEDYVYELSQVSWLALGTNALSVGGAIWQTDVDSPLYVVVDGTSTSRVSATVR